MFIKNDLVRNKQIVRLLGKVPTVAAAAYRHRIGRPHNMPRNDMDYAENFLYMLDHLTEPDYRPHPTLVRAMDIMFILHADHELNCSTAAMRHIGSSRVDPYSAVAGAAAALYGPLHGGANEAVLRMLEEIGSVDQVPSYLEQVKKRQKRLMGFGHRVYRNYDPRAKIIRKVAYDVSHDCLNLTILFNRSSKSAAKNLLSKLQWPWSNRHSRIRTLSNADFTQMWTFTRD